MLLIWGTKGFENKLGMSRNRIECPNCHNEVQTQVVQYGSKFSLFFLPLFTVRSQYIEECPICKAHRKVEKSELDDLLA